MFSDKQQEVDINSLRLSESEEDTKVNIFDIISKIISMTISMISMIRIIKFVLNRVVVVREEVKEHPCLKSAESNDLLATPTGSDTNNTNKL